MLHLRLLTFEHGQSTIGIKAFEPALEHPVSKDSLSEMKHPSNINEQ